MDANMAAADDQMEASVTGSTGGTSSLRTGKGAKSAATRAVPSKYMQMGAAPPTGHRQDVSGRDSYHLRAGHSMGYASTAATPANMLHAGRSVHLASTVKATGIGTTRTAAGRDAHHHYNPSPGGGNTTHSAASMAAPFQLSMAFDAAAQERLKDQLARYKQDKAARAGIGGPAAAPTATAAIAGGGAAGAPRVPALALGILREGAQALGDGSRSARGTGGVYSCGTGGGGAQMSARGGQLHSARHRVQARPAAAAATARAGGAMANPAKAPPVPRMPAMPPPNMVEQQLRTAVNAPLPKDEVWEAAQVALPADGFEEGASGPAAAKTPSSRITKSPRVVALGGAGGYGTASGQAHPMQPPPVPAPAPSQQQYGLVPPRSPPPPSSRAMPAGSQAAAPSAAGSMAADAYGGRMTANAEASTSDTGGRSIRDQIKMARLQELQFRVLKAKMEVAHRARVEKGLRQLGACSLLLTDMMDQYTVNNAKLAAAQAMKKTQYVLESQLPLLEQWKELQDMHGPATREVLTALQNALTSLPLVNGAALGMGGGDGTQALTQLRRAILGGVGALQSAEAALGMLLHGINTRISGGGSAADARGGPAQSGQGGVTAMATLLPQLHAELVGEVANLRSLLTNLNTMATKFDEVACLRARSAAAALAAPGRLDEPGRGGFWGEGAGGSGCMADPAAARLGAKAAMPNGAVSNVNFQADLDRALAMLGLGIGDA